MTKNVGLNQALEAVLEIQIQKPAKEPLIEEVAQKKELKMQWCCPVCTFLNSDQNQTCVMCATSPPDDAYVIHEIIEVDVVEDQIIEESK